jgi:glycosyltransferase involved in cell wall biosynthesis
MAPGKRVALVTNEILGLVRTGGAGTANTSLAFALAGLGHEVEIFATPPPDLTELDSAWARRYREYGVGVNVLRAKETVVPASMSFVEPVQDALRDAGSEVVIAGDWAGPAYGALRMRQLGLGFGETLFVVYCHGTNEWVYDAHGKVRRSITSFELGALERESIELADAVVSPSAYMLESMRERGWKLPRMFVVPYITQATVDAPSSPRPFDRVDRVVFFGRLEDRKGIRPFVEALNLIGSNLPTGLELLFVGRETPAWPPERVRDALSPTVTDRLAAIRFETDLDQPEALEVLARPRTLAVMPSLVDNSPNVIYECLEHGIPFLAGNAGGGPELVDAADRARVFVPPTPSRIAAGLQRALRDPTTIAAPRPAFRREQTLAQWREVLELSPRTRSPEKRPESSDFVLLVEDGDEPAADCLATLEQAQAASGADVITCGTRTSAETHLYLGEPRELGLLGNYYGVVALCRRSLLDKVGVPAKAGDGSWALLAGLSAAGASIVSVPRVLARTSTAPAKAATDPIAALAVAQVFEPKAHPEWRLLPRLAVSLAARVDEPSRSPSPFERARWVWQHEGPAGFAHRASRWLREAPVQPTRVWDRGRTERPAARGSKANPDTG